MSNSVWQSVPSGSIMQIGLGNLVSIMQIGLGNLVSEFFTNFISLGMTSVRSLSWEVERFTPLNGFYSYFEKTLKVYRLKKLCPNSWHPVKNQL